MGWGREIGWGAGVGLGVDGCTFGGWRLGCCGQT